MPPTTAMRTGSILEDLVEDAKGDSPPYDLLGRSLEIFVGSFTGVRISYSCHFPVA